MLRRSALGLLFFAALSVPAVQGEPGGDNGPQASAPEKFRSSGEKSGTETERRQLLGELYDRLGKAENPDSARLIASAIEKLWLRSGSDTVDLLMSRAGVLIMGAQPGTALHILNSIVELAPGYSEGWARRAALYFNLKEFSKSLDDLRQALAIDPSHYKAIQGLGFLMLELGDKKAALQAVRKALKVYPHLEAARKAEEELTREVEGQSI